MLRAACPGPSRDRSTFSTETATSFHSIATSVPAARCVRDSRHSMVTLSPMGQKFIRNRPSNRNKKFDAGPPAHHNRSLTSGERSSHTRRRSDMSTHGFIEPLEDRRLLSTVALLTRNNRLFIVDSDEPGVVLSARTIGGLAAG